MKSKFYKKVFLGLVIIMVLGILSTGCLGGGVTPPPPPPPTTCTVIVTSQSSLVDGDVVYMDGAPQPNTNLVAWGSVQIFNVTVGVYHNFMILRGNQFSQQLFITTVPGLNYVHFYTF